MKKVLFILGRNWRLALSEIDIYLQTTKYRGNILDYSTTVAVVEFQQEQEIDDLADLMTRLGQSQKIGMMLDFIPEETLQAAYPPDIEENRSQIYNSRKYIDNTLKDIYYEIFREPEGKKLFIANSIYPIEFTDPYYKLLVKHFLQYANKFFNTYMKEKGAKQAVYYKYPENEIESGNLNPIFPHHFETYELYKPDRAELLYCHTEQGMYLGKTVVVIDSNFQKKIDENRPYKDFRQTIPPKFAKYLLSLLNLSEPLEDKKILDPFCGTGTNLMFAYIQGFEVYGADVEETQVIGTRQNIKYTANQLEEDIKEKELQDHIKVCPMDKLDTTFPARFFDGIITEPVLLPFYREKPHIADVQQEVNKSVIPIYKKFLGQAYSLLKGSKRLALVAPIIHTQEKKRVHIPLANTAKEVGFIPIPIMNPNRLPTVTRESLDVKADTNVTFFDWGTERIGREFFLFQKPSRG
jgi:tRNA G10  N-methylase Trm11